MSQSKQQTEETRERLNREMWAPEPGSPMARRSEEASPRMEAHRSVESKSYGTQYRACSCGFGQPQGISVEELSLHISRESRPSTRNEPEMPKPLIPIVLHGRDCYARTEVDCYIKSMDEALATERAALSEANRKLEERTQERDAFAQSFKDRSELLGEARKKSAALTAKLKDRDNHISLAYDALGDVNKGVYLFEHIRVLSAKLQAVERERDKAVEGLR